MDTSALQANCQRDLLSLIMRFIYSFNIALYTAAIHAASLFNKKARAWVRGRKGWKMLLRQWASDNAWLERKERIWVHCASVGEFEQGRPLLEKIRREKPNAGILLTFFSPSGYELRKNYPIADHVCYLPADLPAGASTFLDIVKPTHAIFIKYEFWFNYLSALRTRGIRHYLVSGIFRREQVFFRRYGTWFRKALVGYDRIFLQDESSARLLAPFTGIRAEICGDTRFDRVITITQNNLNDSVASQYIGNKKVIVCGSTWDPDEEMLCAWTNTHDPEKKWNIILAPHEITEGHLRSIEKKFDGRQPLRYSQAEKSGIPNSSSMLVIDHIGSLAKLYHYGTICYVGGGFGDGIHNILEAAVHGKPVLFGPRHSKFPESDALIHAGGAFEVRTASELAEKIHFWIQDPRLLQMAGMVSREYVLRNSGATNRVYHEIFP